MVNFNCFHSFSTEIMNCRAYFTVVRIFNEWRHFKYVQTNVNTLECCHNGSIRLVYSVHAHDTILSAVAEEFQNGTYLKNMPRISTVTKITGWNKHFSLLKIIMHVICLVS